MNNHFRYVWKEREPSKLKLFAKALLSVAVGWGLLWLALAVATSGGSK